MPEHSRNPHFYCVLRRLTNNILSTAQQVWLQKLGGAQNPVKQYGNDIEKELSEIQKSVSEIDSTRKVPKKTEKLTSGGLSPGERLTFTAYH